MAGRILLITDGAAAVAYGPALLQRLRDDRYTVRVAPTGYEGASALAFVSEAGWSAFSGHPCMAIERLGHDDFAAADAIVLAPVSMAVASVFLRGRALPLLQGAARPVLVAPALLAAQAADDALRRDFMAAAAALPPQSAVLWPHQGEVVRLAAMGEVAASPVETLAEAIHAALDPHPLAGRRVLLTAGPTVEDFDPVRFVSNRSTGKMGVALALAARRAGAQVTLIHGPLSAHLPRVEGVLAVPVRSAAQMHQAVMDRHRGMDLAILCAAVADFRPVEYAMNKIKKADGVGLVMPLERTRDILAELGAIPRNERPYLVGFAAESNDVRDNALGKLWRKHCDMLCCNDIKAPGCGFATDTNQIVLYFADGSTSSLPMLSKMEAATKIVAIAAGRMAAESR